MPENSVSNQNNDKQVYSDNKQSIKILDARLKLTAFIATISISALGVGILGLSIFSTVSLQSEKKELIYLRDRINEQVDQKISQLESSFEEQRKRIDSFISKFEREPDVIALTLDNEPLAGQTIDAKIKGEKLSFYVVIKNIGRQRALLSVLGLYTKEGLIFEKAGRPVDIIHYKYRNYLLPEKIEGISEAMKNLPAKLSQGINFNMSIKEIDKNRTTFPIMLKIYYGGEKPNIYEFYLKLVN